ncbi:MAG: S8 family serine peptidase [Candidatus Hatepunaea meridiana]|nr:S8 family serine peptidase [Candidatus Hatepunaea meridiana]
MFNQSLIKTLWLIILLLTAISLSFASYPTNYNDGHYELDALNVQFKASVLPVTWSYDQYGQLSTNLTWLNTVISQNGIEAMDRVYLSSDSYLSTIDTRLAGWYCFIFSTDVDIESMTTLFEGYSDVNDVQPIARSIPLDPNDPRFDEQWAHQITETVTAWDDGDGEVGDPAVTIMFIDAGVDWNHPELENQFWINENEDDGDDVYEPETPVGEGGDFGELVGADGAPGILHQDDDGDGGTDWNDPQVISADYDMDGTRLYGGDQELDTNIDEFLNQEHANWDQAIDDDDYDDLILAAYDDDEDGYADNVIGMTVHRQFPVGHENFEGLSNPLDYLGHGTMVTGIAAATTNNEIGLSGVAGGWSPDAAGVNYIMFRTAGRNATRRGLEWAALTGVENEEIDILSISFVFDAIYDDEGLPNDPFLDILVESIPVCVAAGNGGGDAFENRVNYGAASYPGVIGITGTTHDDYAASYTNYEIDFRIAGPCETVLVTTPTYEGWKFNTGTHDWARNYAIVHGGTSAATPYVAGVAALIKSANPELTGPEISLILQATADDINCAGTNYFDAYGKMGSGRVNAAAAVAAADDDPVPRIVAKTYELTDNGNGDGIVIPGETFEIVQIFENVWADADNVIVTLINDEGDDIQIGDGVYDYGDIESGDRVINDDDPFTFTVSGDYDVMESPIELHYHVNSDEGAYEVDLPIYFRVPGSEVAGDFPVDLGYPLVSSPTWVLVDDGEDLASTVFAIGGSNGVYAYREDGTLFGIYETGARVSLSPASARVFLDGWFDNVGAIIAVDDDGDLYCWNATTGELICDVVEIGDNPIVSPVIYYNEGPETMVVTGIVEPDNATDDVFVFNITTEELISTALYRTIVLDGVAVGDADGDYQSEIFIISTSEIGAYHLSSLDGVTLEENFRNNIPGTPTTVVVGDLEYNEAPFLDVVTFSIGGWVLIHDGETGERTGDYRDLSITNLTASLQNPRTENRVENSLILANVRGDDKLEIITTNFRKGSLYVWDQDMDMHDCLMGVQPIFNHINDSVDLIIY